MVDVRALALARPPTLGDGRLVCLDGPAASGKTTLSGSLGGHVVHMDDLYPGWDGLPQIHGQLEGLLRPLATGRPGSYRRYDWERNEFAETVVVEPVPLLVLEGVGSGAVAFSDLCTLLVWIEAPHDLRMRRGVERDGEAFAQMWQQWARDEAVLFEREQTKSRADVVLDGTRPVAEQ